MLSKKVQWIAEELNKDGDDVYDAMLGNITKPTSFVNDVQALAIEYDNLHTAGMGGSTIRF